MRQRLKRKIPRHYGYSLLLALMILSAILTGAVALSRLVILNIRQVRLVDEAISAASYAASGLEKALFLTRKAKMYPQNVEFEILFEENDGPASVKTMAKIGGEKFLKILQDDFLSFDLSLYEQAGEVEINADFSSGCQTGWAEVALIDWVDNQYNIFRQVYSNSEMPITISLNPNSKELRIKALYCDINNLSAQIASGEELRPLPHRIVIHSEGQYRNAKRVLQASVLPKPPLSGLFDFVLFSECSLIKGEEPQCP